MREFANLHPHAWVLRLTALAGLAMAFAALLAFLAPFGTYRFTGVERVGYWTVQMAAWLALSQAAAWLLGQVPGMRAGCTSLRRIAITLLAAVPMMLVTGAANNMMNGWQPDPGEVAELFISIALIGGAYVFLGDRLIGSLVIAQAERVTNAVDGGEPDGTAKYTDSLPAIDPSNTMLIDRLPAHIQTDILCLQVEDHYVRVHSRHGSAMVLMRFSDALRGVGHLAGSQVHRSWWVAADAVVALRRTGRTAQLTLSNGTSVPVSQPYLADAVRWWGEVEMRSVGPSSTA
jgi:DNA-binding LytR/AlgR family response regulator